MSGRALDPHEPAIGDVWESLDKRQRGRLVRIEAVHAHSVDVVTVRALPRGGWEEGGKHQGRRTSIRLAGLRRLFRWHATDKRRSLGRRKGKTTNASLHRAIDRAAEAIGKMATAKLSGAARDRVLAQVDRIQKMGR